MSKWPMTPLGEVLTPYQKYIEAPEPKEYPKLSVKLYGKGVVLDAPADGASLKMKRHQLAKTGQVILSEIWGKKGALGFVPPEGDGALCTSHFFLFDVHRDKLEPKYLQAIFTANYLQDQLDIEAKGTTGYAAVRPKNLLTAEIPLPPLPEQRRIVARIESLAAKIEEAAKVRQIASNEPQVFLARQIDAIFDELSRHHRKRAFGSYDPHVTSGPRNWAKHYQDGGLRFYRAQDIGLNGEVLHESKVFIEPPPGGQGRSAFLQPGDLMLVITGETVGRCSVFRNGLEPGFVSQHVGICRLPKDSVDPDFALWGLRGPQGQEQLLGQRYGQGKPGLNLSNIRAVTLPIPPLPEQRRIVAYLDSLQAKVGALKKLQAETAAELDALLPSILDKAFKGEL